MKKQLKEASNLNKKVFAINQIFLLVGAIFAFAFFVGGIEEVSGQDFVNEGQVVDDSIGTFSLPRGDSTPTVVARPAPSNPFGVKLEGAGEAGAAIDTKGITLSPAKTASFRPVIEEGRSVLFEHGGSQHKLAAIHELDDGRAILTTSKGEEITLASAEEYRSFDRGLEEAGVPFERFDPNAPAQHKAEVPLLGEVSGGWAHLYDGLSTSLLVVGAIQLIGGLAGLDEGLTNTASIAAFGGIMTFKGLQALGPTGTGTLSQGNFLYKNAGWIGLAAAAITFIALYEEESEKIVTFHCLPWEANIGGDSCESCNDDPFRPCSEYRCRSLGQACELVNEGTEEEKCVWVNPRDVESPTITPWEDALSEDHVYTSHETRPTSLGTKIVRNGGACLAPFTPIEFGVQLNEPAQCKIDFRHTEAFDDMTYFFDDSNYFKEEHKQMMRLPSPNSLPENEGLEIGAGGNYDFYVRCQDKNGNQNVDEFVFSFCVDDTPDTTPPLIEETSILSGSPVAFGIGEAEVGFFTNEPADCRWSITDVEYELMNNEMDCSNKVHEQNARQLYTCDATLTGIKDREINEYYVRCKDQPGASENERNVNTQSYEFSLRGTQELNIIDFGPDGVTISDSTEVVDVELYVETSNGESEGRSTCYFSPNGNEGTFVKMFETDSFDHSQPLTLIGGNYEYTFRCIDLGGNSDEVVASFNVLVDQDAPQVTRAYKEGVDGLKIVTNENADCAYSLNNCNFVFDEGIRMLHSDPNKENVNFAEWVSTQTYYIKCMDDFGNEPGSNQCSIVASATNIF